MAGSKPGREMSIVTKVKRFWTEHPEASLTDCERATGCARPTASKYRPRAAVVVGGSQTATVNPGQRSASSAATVDPPQQKAVDSPAGHEFDALYPVKQSTPQESRAPATPKVDPVKPAPVAQGNATPPQQESREPPRRPRNWSLKL